IENEKIPVITAITIGSVTAISTSAPPSESVPKRLRRSVTKDRLLRDPLPNLFGECFCNGTSLFCARSRQRLVILVDTPLSERHSQRPRCRYSRNWLTCKSEVSWEKMQCPEA